MNDKGESPDTDREPESQSGHRREIDGYDVAGRPFATTAPLDIYVNPQTGSDSNPGTESEPVATFQEALDRLPLFVVHCTTIHLEPGIYDRDPRAIQSSVHEIFFYKRPENPYPFRILGDPENPGDVLLCDTGWTNLSIKGTVPYRTVIEGVQFDGKLQNYSGAFTVRNCRFTGRLVDNPPNAIDGYNGFTIVRNCSFGDQVRVAAYANQGHQICLANCDGTVETACRTSMFGEVEYADSNEITES